MSEVAFTGKRLGLLLLLGVKSPAPSPEASRKEMSRLPQGLGTALSGHSYRHRKSESWADGGSIQGSGPTTGLQLRTRGAAEVSLTQGSPQREKDSPVSLRRLSGRSGLPESLLETSIVSWDELWGCN